jgi:hypothetical protein
MLTQVYACCSPLTPMQCAVWDAGRGAARGRGCAAADQGTLGRGEGRLQAQGSDLAAEGDPAAMQTAAQSHREQYRHTVTHSN